MNRNNMEEYGIKELFNQFLLVLQEVKDLEAFKDKKLLQTLEEQLSKSARTEPELRLMLKQFVNVIRPNN